MRTTLSAAADYFLNFLVLCIFAAIGTIDVNVPIIFFFVALGLNIAFLGGIASGYTLRFNDPSITGAQVMAGCGINLMLLFLAPQIAYMFLVNLFVPLSFGSLHFTRRGFLMAWFLLAVCLTGVMMILGDKIGFALSTPAERGLCYAVLALAFGRFLAINAEVSRLRVRLQKKNKELARATMQLAELATHDELTGVWNRRKFVHLVQDEIDRARRNGSTFCVAMADLDYFRAINEMYGFQIGDAVLQQLARLLDGSLRSSDRVARYGGEEFAMLLVDTQTDAGSKMVERVRDVVENFDWDMIQPGMKITLSVGITRWEHDDTHTRLLNRADTALHRAKNAGRNCVVMTNQ